MAESKIELLTTPLTGGCQCGAVRYELAMQPVGAHFCHCRMCQRAVGNVFAALAPVLKDKLWWSRKSPEFFKSSTAAQRGFCPKCGTPLTFAYNTSKWICVTIGSLDDPTRVPPTVHYGIESQVHWLHLHDELPREETGVNDDLKNMTVFQFQGQSHG
ncbi:MAG: GFA family protein [Hydrocarboniphaga effusa]|nr:GFA family protein [Hydrocarboniphaga effusa]